MNKKEMFLLFWGIIFILLVGFGISRLNKYLNATIDYKSLECSDRAYMIYKNYDNQSAEFKDKDWSSRNEECVKIEAKYEQPF